MKKIYELFYYNASIFFEFLEKNMRVENLIAKEEKVSHFTAHYWQSNEWEKAKKESGCRTFWFEHENAKTLVIERKAHWLKFWVQPLWEIPRGPIGEIKNFEKLLEKIIIEAKNNNVSTLRIYPPFGTENFWNDEYLQNFCEKNIHKTAPEIFPTNTLVIDTSADEKDILMQMKQKGRYNIKLAKKRGVEIIEEKDISNFWNLMKTTSKRDGFRSCKKHVYEDMLKSFGDNAVLLTAKDETGEVLASALFTIAGEMAIYNYGASSNKKRNVMAPYLLQWKGIKWAKKKGATVYDFLGISPENDENHHLKTVAGFKLKFGGIRIVCDKGLDFIL